MVKDLGSELENPKMNKKIKELKTLFYEINQKMKYFIAKNNSDNENNNYFNSGLNYSL